MVTTAGITSAASFAAGPQAPASIVSVFGLGLADVFAQPGETPLPTTFMGTTVEVTDSEGVTRASPLFFVSDRQVNLQLSPEAALGPATLTVRRDDGDFLSTPLAIAGAAPGLFSIRATGSSTAAAQFLRVAANGDRAQENVFDADLNPAPIDLGPEGERIFLLLFGTGVRGAAAVSATVDGETVPLLGAVPQGEFVGLDQINVGPLPRSLAGRGVVDVVLTADGLTTNAVTVSIQ